MNEDREENGYPARSHDCQPAETEFAEDFELSQQDVERREKNAKKKRTMVMWKNSLKHVWETRPIEETQKLIDRMPKIMNAIIEAEGFRTPYWFCRKEGEIALYYGDVDHFQTTQKPLFLKREKFWNLTGSGRNGPKSMWDSSVTFYVYPRARDDSSRYIQSQHL